MATKFYADSDSVRFFILTDTVVQEIKNRFLPGTIFQFVSGSTALCGSVVMYNIEDQCTDRLLSTYMYNFRQIEKLPILPQLLAIKDRRKRLTVLNSTLWVDDGCRMKEGDVVDVLKPRTFYGGGRINSIVNMKDKNHDIGLTFFEVQLADDVVEEFRKQSIFTEYRTYCNMTIDEIRKAAAGDSGMYKFSKKAKKADSVEKSVHSSSIKDNVYFMLKEDVNDSLTNKMHRRGTLCRYDVNGTYSTNGKLRLTSMEINKGYETIESTRQNLEEIWPFEFSLFLAVEDLKRRSEVVLDEKWREEAVTIDIGTVVNVYWGSDVFFEGGVVCYKGTLTNINGTYFGVRLTDTCTLQGENDGTMFGKNYFNCKPKRGMFLNIGQIKKPDTNGKWEVVKGASDKKAKGAAKERSVTEHKLKPGCRVSVEIEKKEELGTLRWIGELPVFPGKVWTGIEFDNHVGIGNGKWNKKPYFHCAPGFGKYYLIKHVKHSTKDCHDLQYEDRVVVNVSGRQETATVKWFGKIKNSIQSCPVLVGVELDNAAGDHSGVFFQTYYYKCKAAHGKFVPLDRIRKLGEGGVCVGDEKCYGNENRRIEKDESRVDDNFSPKSEVWFDHLDIKTPMPNTDAKPKEIEKWVKENLCLQINDEIVLPDDKTMEPGKIRWLGYLPKESMKGLHAGIEFDHKIGTCDGNFKKKTLFKCKERHGSFIPVLALLKRSDLEISEKVKYKTSIPQPGVSTHLIQKWVFENLKIEIGERVYIFLEKEECLKQGIIRWIGHLPDATKTSSTIFAGVELNHPEGNSNGLYKKKQIFECKENYGIFVPVEETIKVSDVSDEDEMAGFENETNDAIHSIKKDPQYPPASEADDCLKHHFESIESSVNLYGTDSVKPKKIHQTLEESQDYLKRVQEHKDKMEEDMSKNAPSTSIRLHGNGDASFSNDDKSSKWSNEFMADKTQYYDAQDHLEKRKEERFANDDYSKLKKDQGVVQPPRLEDISIAERICYGNNLEVGAAVEVSQKNTLYGTVRWIGKRIVPDRDDEYIAGIEAEEDYPGGTDGTFLKQRMFRCRPKRALFVRVTQCKCDTRFEEIPVSMPFGHVDTPDVEGYIGVPVFTRGVQKYCGTFKGIQGHHNSCYMDATLFAMFFATEAFDQIFSREKQKGDSVTFEEVKNTLKHGIVNPLRQTFYVRADKVIKLRALLDQHGSVKGITNEEKDPEEFLNSLMNEVLQARPFINLDSGQTSNMFQLFCEKDNDLDIPNVQQIVEQSFLQSGIKLAEIPKCLILQMPRFGKDYKLYPQIIPSLKLDITNILDGSFRLCVVCGKMAEVECPSCYKGFSTACISDITFCKEDHATVHYHHKRKGHVPKDLHVKKQYRESNVVHELFLTAVVCIETSHYVSFVKCDKTWIFFDSMADRKGEANGYNIPEIKECPELVGWLEPTDKNIQRILNTKPRDLPPSVRRVLGDAYLCLYQCSSDDLLY